MIYLFSISTERSLAITGPILLESAYLCCWSLFLRYEDTLFAFRQWAFRLFRLVRRANIVPSTFSSTSCSSRVTRKKTLREKLLEGTTHSLFHSQRGSGCLFFADFARVLLACWNRIGISLSSQYSHVYSVTGWSLGSDPNPGGYSLIWAI